MVGPVGDHENAVSFADQAVAQLGLARLPVDGACAHDGQAQLSVVVRI